MIATVASEFSKILRSKMLNKRTRITLYRSPDYNINWPFEEKKFQIDFQDSGHGVHLGFLIGTILALFIYKSTLMLPIKFGVNWPFSSGEEATNRVSRWQPWRPSRIPNQDDFSCFDLLVTPMLPIKFLDNWPFGFKRRSEK